MTLLLALDTSTRFAGVALFDGTQVLSETAWLAGREHSTRLLVEVELAFERVGRQREELTGLVVAKGPGSFTGVRVALSVAKGIAAALHIPAWGVDSLDVLAFAVSTDLPVRAVLEAGRSRYATALYTQTSRTTPHLMTLAQLGESIETPTFVIGELDEAARAALEANPNARLAPRSASARRAGYLAEVGYRQAALGDPGDATMLDALYAS